LAKHASAISLPVKKINICLTHRNGRARTSSKRATLGRIVLWKSQDEKHRAAGQQALRTVGTEPEVWHSAAGGNAARIPWRADSHRRDGYILLPATEQIGLLPLVGVNLAARKRFG